MRGINSEILLSDDEFYRIRTIVYKRTGIALTESKRALIIARLSKRFVEKNIPDFGTYLNILEKDERETLELINRITTNLTYFYREAEQFKILKSSVLPEILKDKSKNVLRIWSAACSTGAEVYTILFEIIDYFKGTIPAGLDIKILGSDIDTTVLTKARKGVYNDEEIAGLPLEKRDIYFNKNSDGLYEIKESYKKYVGFRKINLVNDEFSFKGEIDIVFCRNVAIYFDEATKENMYRKFHKIITKNGYFFSGQSENLFKWKDMYKFIKKSIYKKVS